MKKEANRQSTLSEFDSFKAFVKYFDKISPELQKIKRWNKNGE